VCVCVRVYFCVCVCERERERVRVCMRASGEVQEAAAEAGVQRLSLRLCSNASPMDEHIGMCTNRYIYVYICIYICTYICPRMEKSHCAHVKKNVNVRFTNANRVQ